MRSPVPSPGPGAGFRLSLIKSRLRGATAASIRNLPTSSTRQEFHPKPKGIIMSRFSAVVSTVCLGAALLCSPMVQAEELQQVSQYGITWTFDRPVRAGQFINGDWWVIGPVTISRVTPAPGPESPDVILQAKTNVYGDTSLRSDLRMRNGSMVLLRAGTKQGYDSRNQSYDPSLSLNFPAVIEPNRSVISTISNPTIPVARFPHEIMWPSEKTCQNTLRVAAVLTVLAEAPPPDAFRPSYAGTTKPIYRAAQLKWELLKQLPAPAIDPAAYPAWYELRVPDDWTKMERYFQRAWIDHLTSWEQQELNPSENQPNYGREYSRLVSIASLMLHLDVPQERKRKLLIGLVQYGIDLSGVAQVGGYWNWGGGLGSGRKWPIYFASLMLDAPALRTLPEKAVFHEDAQCYYGTGWAGQTALNWMVEHHGRRLHYEERDPGTWDSWDKLSEMYRTNTNAVSWVGTALAVRLMQGIVIWNHDSYFDYCDRWMEQEDSYAANRGPYPRPIRNGEILQESQTRDPFVTEMWRAYRASAPAQPMAGNPRRMVWTDEGLKWVPNPKPDAKAVADHVAAIKAARP